MFGVKWAGCAALGYIGVASDCVRGLGQGCSSAARCSSVAQTFLSSSTYHIPLVHIFCRAVRGVLNLPTPQVEDTSLLCLVYRSKPSFWQVTVPGLSGSLAPCCLLRGKTTATNSSWTYHTEFWKSKCRDVLSIWGAGGDDK